MEGAIEAPCCRKMDRVWNDPKMTQKCIVAKQDDRFHKKSRKT